MSTCLTGTNQLLITSVLVKREFFFFRRSKIDVLFFRKGSKEQFADKKDQNTQHKLLFHGEKLLTRLCTKVWQNSVFHSSIISCKAPWEGMIFCCDAERYKLANTIFYCFLGKVAVFRKLYGKHDFDRCWQPKFYVWLCTLTKLN